MPFCKHMTETQDARGLTGEEDAEPRLSLFLAAALAHPVILPCCGSCLLVNPLSCSVQVKLLISISLCMLLVLFS